MIRALPTDLVRTRQTTSGLIHLSPAKNITFRVVLFVLIVETVILTTNYWRDVAVPSKFTLLHNQGNSGVTVSSDYEVSTATPDTPPQSFLDWYTITCIEFMNPKVTGKRMPLCPCLPDTLVGRMNVSEVIRNTPSTGEMEMSFTDLLPGGQWKPSKCIARQKVALIIPFRDREDHLRIFLYHMHNILQRQQLDYRVLVIEQSAPVIFNKAALMNIGFLEAKKRGPFDCYVFHDVDMLAEDDRNMYTCLHDSPRHIGAYVNNFNYMLPYEGLIGGATGFTAAQFEKVNGFTNEFYGWGGEDDDMEKRLHAQNMTIMRYPRSVSRYTMVKHGADKHNPYNFLGSMSWKYRPEHYPLDGVNNVRYKVDAVELRPLYTWLSITLPWPKFKSAKEYLQFQYIPLSSSITVSSYAYLICTAFIIRLLLV